MWLLALRMRGFVARIYGLIVASITVSREIAWDMSGWGSSRRSGLPELLQDVFAGKLDPSPVLDMTVDLDGIPAGYAAMDTREAIKVMVRL